MSDVFQVNADGVYELPAEAPNADVIAEIEQLQNKKAGWGKTLLILFISLVLFLGIGIRGEGWTALLLLIAVLFFHEMGHYVAMKVFGYRNVQMFFIPLFGAAVSGKHYNVSGWKKAVVSLMGPVPGIVLGVGLGMAGLLTHQPKLTMVALTLLLLNGFNLLPVLPLDGGWILHATLFSRHPVLDVGFRGAAGVALLALGLFGPTKIPLFLAFPLLISLPTTYRMARIADQLRRSGVPPLSADTQTIPNETAQLIITEVRQSFPTGMTPRTIAQATIQIFETLNAHPPHWLVTISLLVVHAFSFLLALVVSIVLVVAQSDELKKLRQPAAQQAAASPVAESLRGSELPRRLYGTHLPSRK